MRSRIPSIGFLWLALGASALQAQMMGGGRDVRAGREAMNERLANATPDQRAWLEAIRDERAGTGTVRQRLTLRAGVRSYQLGSTEVSERLALVSYVLRRPGWRFGVAGGPLRFREDDSVAITGVSPFHARLDLVVGARDSLRIAARSPSSPMTLSGAQVAALASVGTAVVDLSSVEFGTPASIAAQYARTQPLSDRLSASLTIGVDYEPRPSSSRWSYWRGTTARAGLTVSGGPRRAQLTAGVDVTRSFADSLEGRNLFPGGGTVLARVGAATLLGAAQERVLDISALYFRPLAIERIDAANRRTPVGDFVGSSAIVIWPLGDLLVTPVLVISRESSRDAAGTTTTTGSGWAIGSSLGIDIPVASRWSLTPELGYARGSLRSDLGPRPPGAGGPGIAETLSGWWFATDVSVSF